LFGKRRCRRRAAGSAPAPPSVLRPALLLGADELVTTEGPGTPIDRVAGLGVVGISVRRGAVGGSRPPRPAGSAGAGLGRRSPLGGLNGARRATCAAALRLGCCLGRGGLLLFAGGRVPGLVVRRRAGAGPVFAVGPTPVPLWQGGDAWARSRAAQARSRCQLCRLERMFSWNGGGVKPFLWGNSLVGGALRTGVPSMRGDRGWRDRGSARGVGEAVPSVGVAVAEGREACVGGGMAPAGDASALHWGRERTWLDRLGNGGMISDTHERGRLDGSLGGAVPVHRIHVGRVFGFWVGEKLEVRTWTDSGSTT